MGNRATRISTVSQVIAMGEYARANARTTTCAFQAKTTKDASTMTMLASTAEAITDSVTTVLTNASYVIRRKLTPSRFRKVGTGSEWVLEIDTGT